MSKNLRGVSQTTLRHLRQWVGQGKLELPLERAQLRERGLDPHTSELLAEILGELSAGPLVAVLDTIVGEREQSERERPRLLWTGPDAAASAALDTRVKLLELIESAQESVFWAGYRFDDPSLLRPLHEAMCTRKIDVTMVLEVRSDWNDGLGREQRVSLALSTFLGRAWIWRDVLPQVFIDPRTTGRTRDPEHRKGGYYSQMHAKTVVVDAQRSIIGSANFTDAGTTRNIEAGVWLDNGEFARALLGQWRGLIANELLEQVDLAEVVRSESSAPSSNQD